MEETKERTWFARFAAAWLASGYLRRTGLFWVCIALGILHAAVTTFFAFAPEVGPLVTVMIDLPISLPLILLSVPDTPILVLCVILGSVGYPAILYWAVRTYVTLKRMDEVVTREETRA